MNCLKLLAILIISAAAVTGFQLNFNPGKLKLLPHSASVTGSVYILA
jgi:hypothetical protein